MTDSPTPRLEGRKVIVAVTGGIAAYKSADLVSRLRKAGAQVRVVMSEAARRFVQPLTFESLAGYPVYEEVFERPTSWEMEHISWARWADAVVVAPATANTLAKMAHGLADDAATTLLLAWRGPVWVAPAMNTAMWDHPATRANLRTLADRGVRLIDPGSGALACGEVGAGRMAEPADIVRIVAMQLALQTPAADGAADLAGKTVLITTGPTREMLDPIRFISNLSSGRMGVGLATEAVRRGARVIVVHGPLSVPLPEGCEAREVRGAREMLAAVQRYWDEVDIAVFAAAVANYEAAAAAEHKIKGGDTLMLELRRTPDIAAWCGANRRAGQMLIGFCAESENLMETAARKLQSKGLDLICANIVGRPGSGFVAANNQVTLLGTDGWREASPTMDKFALAGWIWDRVLARPR